jgi:hypothetical protein
VRTSFGAAATSSVADARRCAALLQGAASGLVDDGDLPRRRQLRRQQRTRRGGVRLVDQAVVAFEPVDDRRVRAEQSPVRAQHRLESGLPPRELELGGDVFFGNVADRQLGEQLLQAHLGEFAAQGRVRPGCRRRRRSPPGRESAQQVGIGNEASGSVRPSARSSAPGRRPPAATPWRHRPGPGDLGHDARIHQLLPLGALLLHAHQRLVHVGDVHARAHVLARQVLQAPALGRCHRGSVTTRRVRLDELRQRTLEDGGAEAIERCPDALQQLHVGAEFGQRRERAHARLRDEFVPALEHGGHLGAVQPSGERVGVAGLLRGGEGDAVPRRIVGAEAELAETGGGRQRLRGLGTAGAERLQGGDVESGRRRRLRRHRRDRGQGAQCLERRDLDARMPLRERVAIVAQHGAQAHERIVDVGHLGLFRLLVARDRADEVAVEMTRRDGQPGSPMPARRWRTPSRVERRALTTSTLAGAHELADRVDHRLRAAGARQRVHGERLSGGDAREHGLLLGIRIEQEPVRGGRALIGLTGGAGARTIDRSSRSDSWPARAFRIG